MVITQHETLSFLSETYSFLHRRREFLVEIAIVFVLGEIETVETAYIISISSPGSFPTIPWNLVSWRKQRTRYDSSATRCCFHSSQW